MSAKPIQLEPKQTMAFMTPATEVLYGGAKGGGKSFLLRVSAIRWCWEVPGIQVYLFRRKLPDLRRNHLQGPTSFFSMLRSDLKQGRVKFKAVDNEFEFDNGSVLHLCYCDAENDVENYQGAEMHVLMPDELTHYCVHPDTDVLTKRGWKQITSLQEGDVIATLTAGGEIEFNPCERVWAFDYDGELIEVRQRRGVSFSVTKNHRCVIEPQLGGKWRFERADSLPRYSFHVTGGSWAGREKKTFRLPEPKRGRGLGRNANVADSVPMDDWLEFLGWYLSEGCAFEARGRTPIVSIRQTKPCQDLEALLARLPFRHHKSNDGQYRIFSRQLHDLLAPLGGSKEKRVPAYVFALSRRQIRIFFDAFVRGDGHVDGGGIGIGLCNDKLIDDLQHICVLLGLESTKASGVDKKGFAYFRLSVRAPKRLAVCVAPKDVKRVPYTGLVWCPSVKNKNFVSRFNGRIVVTGNTDYQYRYLRAQVRITGIEIPERYKGRLPRIESGSNPGSVGHAWVRRAFISPRPALDIWKTEKEEGGMLRQFIPARLEDNPHLTKDDPDYAARLHGMGSENLVRAMLEGDWDIVAGAAFEKLRRDIHCIEPFDPPSDWMCFGSLDWGSSKPFSFGLWTVANGNPLPDGRTYRRGAIIRFNEVYGWNGKANEGLRKEASEVADMIRERIGTRRLAYIAADPSMWKVDGGPSIAETMLRSGVVLRKADNSRITGYIQVRQRISGDEDGPMLYATKNCHDGFWRTMPDIVMDDHHPEDVNTDQEDHCYDDVRYAAMSRPWMAVIDGKAEKPDRWMRAFEREADSAVSWKTV